MPDEDNPDQLAKIIAEQIENLKAQSRNLDIQRQNLAAQAELLAEQKGNIDNLHAALDMMEGSIEQRDSRLASLPRLSEPGEPDAPE